MKSILVLIMWVLLSTKSSPAQEDGVSIAKRAGLALASYNIDPIKNFEKLEEARMLVEQSLEKPQVQAMMNAWLIKANIYHTRLQRDMIKRQNNPTSQLSGDNDALVAFVAYKRVYALSQSKAEKTDAINGIKEVEGHLVNIGLAKYERQDYEKSFLSFQAALSAHALLKESGRTSLLDNPEQKETQVYITALAASMANRCADALVFYNELYDAGTDKPAIYAGLYHCKQELGDEAGAGRILAEGRKKFPDDRELLFAEINLLLKAGKLNDLIGRLEKAIAAEPGNLNLYVKLGNVYDNLFQTALGNSEEVKADGYFNEAKRYYDNVIQKDPGNLDGTYSLGALYYAKAAFRTQKRNLMTDDFSVDGLEKARIIQEEITGLFNQALPYFKKAEAIDPNDINTLIALIEIFTRKDDVALSSEMKKRLDVVRTGGKNQSSYFR